MALAEGFEPSDSFLSSVFWTDFISHSNKQAYGAEGEGRTHMPLSRRQLSKLLQYLYATSADLHPLFLLNNKLDYRTQNFTISLLVVILKRFMFFSSCCYLNIFQIYSQSTCSCDMDDFSKTQNQQLLTFKAAAGKSV